MDGNTVRRDIKALYALGLFDDIRVEEGDVYVGGDTQGVANLEYRIPVAGHVLTLAPFFDLGNAWVLKKDQLTRQIINAEGQLVKVPVMLLPGTNSSIRTSTVKM